MSLDVPSVSLISNDRDDNTSTSSHQSEQGVSPTALAKWCDQYLQVDAFKDYCPNGLQVDAQQPIRRIVTGVTACEALIDAAIEQNADALLVHHGYFWKGEPSALTGMKGRRIHKLMQHGISLLAYHLPLDAHRIIGNNAVLAAQLDLEITGGLYPEESHPVGNIATCAPISTSDFQSKLHRVLSRDPLVIFGSSEGADRQLQKIALCSGAAQDMIDQAALMGCDAFISGEISERTTHSARELGVDYFACGHHATERGGIKALGELIQRELLLEVSFTDIANPV